jgi:hypothetical protein
LLYYIIGTSGLNSEAFAVSVSGTDVISAGYASDGAYYLACIWTNITIYYIRPAETNSYIKPWHPAY